MKYLIPIVAVLFVAASCTFHEPEFRGGETFKLDKIDGKKVMFTAGAKVYNGNWFGVKVKPSKLDLYIDGDYVGKVHLTKKVKMKAKKETQLEVPFVAELENSPLVQAMGLATKNEVKVRFKGKIKGGVFIFTKKVDFDESRTISPKKLVLK